MLSVTSCADTRAGEPRMVNVEAMRLAININTNAV
jgi:hypothetical protein